MPRVSEPREKKVRRVQFQRDIFNQSVISGGGGRKCLQDIVARMQEAKLMILHYVYIYICIYIFIYCLSFYEIPR